MSETAVEHPPAPSGRKKYEPRTRSAWVHSMIRAYVGQKVADRQKSRPVKTWDDFKNTGFKDKDYRDAVNKVCMDAFYQIRSRKDHREFVNYWTSSICSVPQFIHDNEFADVADLLLDSEGWEDVQSLALLALSAHSQPDLKADAGQAKQP